MTPTKVQKKTDPLLVHFTPAERKALGRVSIYAGSRLGRKVSQTAVSRALVMLTETHPQLADEVIKALSEAE